MRLFALQSLKGGLKEGKKMAETILLCTHGRHQTMKLMQVNVFALDTAEPAYSNIIYNRYSALVE